MSRSTKPASPQDVMQLWPAIKAARLMGSAEEFSAFREAAPWRVRVTDSGEALLLAPWRDHLNILAIRGLWSATHRIGDLVDDACAVARAQGLGRVLSPLATGEVRDAYLASGMTVVERIVALQGAVREARFSQLPAGLRLRPARPADVAGLELVDRECFTEFWRYGPSELAESLLKERVTAVETERGLLLGYCTCANHGATMTVGRLAVAPAARRRGVASALLSDAVSWGRGSGAHALTLCTQEQNTASRELYASVGLSELPESYALAMRAAHPSAHP